MNSVLTMIPAGGRGTRLEPLTRDRAKPAVPFGGQYRIIDFVLSYAINSGSRRIYVLTQYKALSLDRHIHTAWHFLNRSLGEFIEIIHPQQRISEQWYVGTADAIYQNIYSIEIERPKEVMILGGDHIYKMNYRSMLDFHRETGAELTIGCLPVPLEEGRRFGVMEVDADRRVTGFQEKPADPKATPEDPTRALASMGIYIFNANVLFDRLCQDAIDNDSGHDFGKDLIPRMIAENARAFAWPFLDPSGGPAYWRDVGTLSEYYASTMDLVQVEPTLNLYEKAWPIRTGQFQDPPPKFVFNEEGDAGVRRGEALDSIVCAGTILSGGRVERSVLARNVRVNSYATVEDSILFDGVNVGRRCRIKRTIIDKDVVIPPDFSIGLDPDHDRARGFRVTTDGLTVVAKEENLGAG